MAEALPARPQAADYKPISELRTIDEALKHPGIVQRFQQAVPQHLSTDRMLRVCSMAVFNTPELGKADMMSLLGAMLQLASLGLEPNTPLGHAYLIPFKARRKRNGQWEEYTTVQVVIGYRGLIDLARRSGNMISIHADVVYEGDDFEFEYGTNMHIRHRPVGTGRNPQWAYAHASLKDGQAFEVLPYAKVLNIRNNSQGYRAALAAKKEYDADPGKNGWRLKTWEASPWVAHEHEMASKTLIRRIAKYLPMSIEFMRAVDLDTLSEDRVLNFAHVMQAPAQQQGEILESLPGVEDDMIENVQQQTAAAPSAPASQPQQEATPASQAPENAAPQPEKRGRGRPPGSGKNQQAQQQPAAAPPPPPPPPEPEPEPEPLPAAAQGETEQAPGDDADVAFTLWCWNGQNALEEYDFDFEANFQEEASNEMQKAFLEGGSDVLNAWWEKNAKTIADKDSAVAKTLGDKFAKWSQSAAKGPTPATQSTPPTKTEPPAPSGSDYV